LENVPKKVSTNDDHNHIRNILIELCDKPRVGAYGIYEQGLGYNTSVDVFRNVS